MGFRFQRRVTLFPGVRLNFSRRGISTTIGPRGASVNFGRFGATLNVGVPGTGLSLRKKLGQSSPNGNRTVPPPPIAPLVPAAAALPESGAREIGSAPAAEVTTDGLESLKRLIIEARAERETLRASFPAHSGKREGPNGGCETRSTGSGRASSESTCRNERRLSKSWRKGWPLPGQHLGAPSRPPWG